MVKEPNCESKRNQIRHSSNHYLFLFWLQLRHPHTVSPQQSHWPNKQSDSGNKIAKYEFLSDVRSSYVGAVRLGRLRLLGFETLFYLAKFCHLQNLEFSLSLGSEVARGQYYTPKD